VFVLRSIQIVMMAVATSACATATVAQVSPETTSVPALDAEAVEPAKDSAATALADEAPRFILTPRNTRLEISVKSRRLWVIAGEDTLRTAPVSVSSGRDLRYAGRTWRFATPRGRMVIRGKRTDPVWLPPDWHYAEIAQQHKFRLAQLGPGTRLKNGDRLAVRDSVVGVIRKGDTAFLALPTTEHVVFDSTLFIPPLATINRRLRGELGDYALDLGDGYMLHGTSDQRTIGTDATHGCIRLADGDLAWLYTYVPVGVAVVVR
jgi:lipoprotein-anchoring transpeptidase ErfK/SrfK